MDIAKIRRLGVLLPFPGPSAVAMLADEIDRLRAELAVARADLAVSVDHLSRLAEAYGCEDFTAAVDAALAAKGE